MRRWRSGAQSSWHLLRPIPFLRPRQDPEISVYLNVEALYASGNRRVVAGRHLLDPLAWHAGSHVPSEGAFSIVAPTVALLSFSNRL